VGFPPHHRSPQKDRKKPLVPPVSGASSLRSAVGNSDIRTASVSSQRTLQIASDTGRAVFLPDVRECSFLLRQHAGMPLRLPVLLLAMLALQAVAGCVKGERPMMISGQPSIPVERQAIADRPIKSYKELIRGFDRTLTDTERKAQIAELRKQGAHLGR